MKPQALTLLGVHLTAARNTFGRTKAGKQRFWAILVLGLGFFAAVYGVAWWFLDACLAIEPIGEVIVRRVLGMVLLALFALLGFSSLVSAFSTYYLADDLNQILSRPVDSTQFFIARFTENTISASWMTTLFSLPVFLAAGHLFGADWSYYGLLLVSLPALWLIPSALATQISLLLTFTLSARRARHVLMVLGGLGVAALLVLLRTLQPERLLNPDQRQSMLSAFNQLRGTDPLWLPPTWALDALWPKLSVAADGQLAHPAWLLVTTAAALFFVTGWLFRKLHPTAFSRAQEGLHRDQRHLADKNARTERDLATLAADLKAKPGKLRFTRVMAFKDARTFTRDTSQWSQLLLLVGIVGMYLLNFRYIRSIGDGRILGLVTLHHLNLALAGFVAVAIAVRFVYPTVSLEGRAFWLIQRSPNSMHAFLVHKWRTASVIMLPLIAVTVVLTNMVLGAGTFLVAAAIATVTPIVFGVTALAVGIGALYPRFDEDNAARISMGLGGVLYMVSAMGLVLLSIGLFAPITVLTFFAESGRAYAGPGALAASTAAAAAGGLLPLGTAALILRRAARALETR